MKKKTIIIIVCICAAAVILLLALNAGSKKGSTDEAVQVITVAELEEGGTIGMVNRFAGVAESQETWSVNQNPDSTIKEVLVSVGDEVKKGDPLFVYDTEKYASDQEQAEIDLERMNNELEALNATIEQLEKEQKKAKASEQADYTIRIQDAELQKKQKELDIRSKNVTIEKLKDSQANATVTSGIDGAVRTINNGNESVSSDSPDSNAFITVMKTGDLRIKGTINEQNMSQISVGTPLTVYSRVDASQTWSGTVTEINTDSAVSSQNGYGYGSGSGSSSYNFYVELENCDGMMIGQHVYLEPVSEVAELPETAGVWVPMQFLDYTDPENPFVWAANASGKLEKRKIVTGEDNYDNMMTEVLEGLTEEDALAMPAETLQEGMPVDRGNAS